jgi:hypothetical protein
VQEEDDTLTDTFNHASDVEETVQSGSSHSQEAFPLAQANEEDEFDPLSLQQNEDDETPNLNPKLNHDIRKRKRSPSLSSTLPYNPPFIHSKMDPVLKNALKCITDGAMENRGLKPTLCDAVYYCLEISQNGDLNVKTTLPLNTAFYSKHDMTMSVPSLLLLRTGAELQTNMVELLEQ